MDSHMSLDACKNKKKCEFDFMHALSIIHYALWENSVSTQEWWSNTHVQPYLQGIHNPKMLMKLCMWLDHFLSEPMFGLKWSKETLSLHMHATPYPFKQNLQKAWIKLKSLMLATSIGRI